MDWEGFGSARESVGRPAFQGEFCLHRARARALPGRRNKTLGRAMQEARQACAQSVRHQPLCGVCARGRHLVDRLKDPPSSCAMYSCTCASVLLYRCDTEAARRFFGTGARARRFFFFARGDCSYAPWSSGMSWNGLRRFCGAVFGAEAKMIDGARPAPVPAPRGGCSANSVRRAALRTSTTPRRRDTAGHSCERAASDIHQAYQATSSIMSQCCVAIHQPERRTYDLQQEVRSVRWQDNSALWTQG